MYETITVNGQIYSIRKYRIQPVCPAEKTPDEEKYGTYEEQVRELYKSTRL